MKLKLKNYLKIVFYVILTTTVVSCAKDKSKVTDTTKVEQKTDYTKIIKFLSITLNVDKSEIKLNKESGEFIIRGDKYNIDEVTERYNNSNEYKAKYEN